MFVSDRRLPHVLAPSSYWEEAAYQREIAHVLRSSWHVVGTTAELAHPGDFLTRVVAGTSLQVRNFNGELRALSNVCAHRHAEICSLTHGNSPTLRCQYHGWEYQSDGRTGRIPAPKNFVPLDRDAARLPQYPLETVGQLVFVNLSPTPIPLIHFMGEEFHARLSERFSYDWNLALRWEPNYQCNWKIPVENSLEAYHVPSVHPHTFKEDPGSDRSRHELLGNRTWFETTLPFSPHSRLDATFQRLEGRFVHWLGHDARGIYQQHHVFPNLLFSFTDAISLVNCVVPAGCAALHGSRAPVWTVAARWWEHPSRVCQGLEPSDGCVN